MEHLLVAVEAARPLRRTGMLLVAGLAALLMAGLQADAAVVVSYGVASDAVTQGGHDLSFSVSKSRGGTLTFLYVNVRKYDNNGTPATTDDVTQTHNYSFTLPGDALMFSDDMSTVSFTSGLLKTGDGSGRDYGKIEFVAKNLAPIMNVPSRCTPYKYRDATLAGATRFNTFLPGIGRLARSSIGGALTRYAYRSPCPDPGPDECSNFTSLSGYNYPKDGSSASLYVARSAGDRFFSLGFSEPDADVAPADVTHALSGGYPSAAFRSASTLRTAKFDGGPVKYLDGAVNFLATAPAQSQDNGDCPDYKTRAGNITGSLIVNFTAGPDYEYTGGTGTVTKYTAS